MTHPLVAAVLALSDGAAQLLRHDETAWRSATFSGARHRIELSFNGAEDAAVGGCLIDVIDQAEFAIARTLVADAAVAWVEHIVSPAPRLRCALDILTLDEAR